MTDNTVIKEEKTPLATNSSGMINYMIQNLCSIYNSGEYYKKENEEILKETIDMLNEIYYYLDCSWTDEEKIPKIIKIIGDYNSTDGSELARKTLYATFRDHDN